MSVAPLPRWLPWSVLAGRALGTLLLVSSMTGTVAMEIPCAEISISVATLLAGQHHEEAVRAGDAALDTCGGSLTAASLIDLHLARAEALQALGRYLEAQAGFGAALDGARAARDPERTIASLSGAATARLRLGNLPGALNDFEAAAGEAVIAGRSLAAARTFANAASVALRLPDATKAAVLLSEARRHAEGIDADGERAFVLTAIGRRQYRLALADPGAATTPRRQAYEVLVAAAGLAARTGDRRTESYALGYLGELYEHAGRREEALTLGRKALFIAQEIAAPDLAFRWHWLIGRLLRAGDDPDGAREQYRVAMDLLQDVRGELRRATATSGDPAESSVSGVYFEYADLLLAQQAAAGGAEGEKILRQARDAVELIKATELEDYFQDDCVAALQARTAGVEAVDPHTAVLYPILFDDRLEILLSLPDGLKRYTTSIDKAALTGRVREFRRLLEKRTTRQYLPHAQALHELLFAPIEEALAGARIGTLVIVPDDVLRLIPLGALHDGRSFLIERHALAVTPGMTLTDPSPLEASGAHVLLSGLTEGVQGFAPLPYVADELATVGGMYGATILQDDAFRVDAVREQLAREPYRIVHVASHAQFGRDATDTFLLTFDGKVSMDGLEQLLGTRKYAEQPIELLTLSACQTAAGDERAALGLAGVAIKAGARSALASLWFINDPASSALVSGFYRRLQAGDTKAQALRAAQLGLLADARYRHPGYWAPFILIGNWL